MIGALISGLFNFILGLIATIIQIVCTPLNALITAAIPDISTGLTAVSTGFSTLFSILGWALNLVPVSLLWIFTFCYGIKLAVSTFSISTKALIRAWNLFQKIKFW